VHSSLGLAAGMVVALVLAYLLELIFPRKATPV
jgi:tetrahydromethanopterin S-methyltransferase subunit F